jgi:hypothetical protein
MHLDAGQLIAISLIGAALAFGIGVFYLLVLLAKWTCRWVAGTGPQTQQPRTQTPQKELVSEGDHVAPVSASDLYVIRSNLNAVARQVEGLEQKLKLSEAYGPNIVSLKRK